MKFMTVVAYTIRMKRIPIAVIEMCGEDGSITPLAVVKDGKEYGIDKVLSVTRHAPNGIACISPMRYDCVVCGVKRVIYKDAHPSHKWFSVK